MKLILRDEYKRPLCFTIDFGTAADILPATSRSLKCRYIQLYCSSLTSVKYLYLKQEEVRKLVLKLFCFQKVF